MSIVESIRFTYHQWLVRGQVDQEIKLCLEYAVLWDESIQDDNPLLGRMRQRHEREMASLQQRLDQIETIEFDLPPSPSPVCSSLINLCAFVSFGPGAWVLLFNEGGYWFTFALYRHTYLGQYPTVFRGFVLRIYLFKRHFTIPLGRTSFSGYP